MTLVSAALVEAHELLSDELHKLWQGVKSFDAMSHAVELGANVRFNTQSVMGLVVSRNVQLSDEGLVRYHQDMSRITGWEGGRSPDSTPTDPDGWVVVKGLTRAEYEGEQPSLTLSFGLGRRRPYCRLHITPLVESGNGYTKEELFVMETAANPDVQPAKLDEVLALSAIARTVKGIVTAPPMA